MPKLNNWSVVVTQHESSDPFTAPELRQMKVSLSGIVTEHNEIMDGENITTSTIVSGDTINGELVCYTQSGSTYVLGDIDPLYEKLFPGARKRFSEVMEKLNNARASLATGAE